LFDDYIYFLYLTNDWDSTLAWNLKAWLALSLPQPLRC
jgi:hypothetical protein